MISIQHFSEEIILLTRRNFFIRFRISGFVVIDDRVFVFGEKTTELQQNRFPIVEAFILKKKVKIVQISLYFP